MRERRTPIHQEGACPTPRQIVCAGHTGDAGTHDDDIGAGAARRGGKEPATRRAGRHGPRALRGDAQPPPRESAIGRDGCSVGAGSGARLWCDATDVAALCARSRVPPPCTMCRHNVCVRLCPERPHPFFQVELTSCSKDGSRSAARCGTPNRWWTHRTYSWLSHTTQHKFGHALHAMRTRSRGARVRAPEEAVQIFGECAREESARQLVSAPGRGWRLYHAHERLSVTLAASSRLDEPEFSRGTAAEAVQVAPFSNLLST